MHVINMELKMQTMLNYLLTHNVELFIVTESWKNLAVTLNLVSLALQGIFHYWTYRPIKSICPVLHKLNKKQLLQGSQMSTKLVWTL